MARLLLCWLLLALVGAAPVQENSIDKRRESTKETIQLEETLKRLAGEDKKYFSNSMAQPLPQIDGLEGSGEEEQQAAEEEQELQRFADPALQDELKAEASSSSSNHQEVPGPYGPGLGTGDGVELEYEPDFLGQIPAEQQQQQQEEEEEEDAEQEQEPEIDEDYFLERVMKTLQRHPEWISELMQDEYADRAAEDEHPQMVANSVEPQYPSPDTDDYADRLGMIQAELAAIRHQSQYSKETAPDYGAKGEHYVVAKKHSSPLMPDDAVPNDLVKDDIDSLNRYFGKYSQEERQSIADAPIM